MKPLNFTRLPPAESKVRAASFREKLDARRTIRDFSAEPIPEGVLEDCLATANGAPSGANLQPWHFGIITSAEMKRRIREAAEAEEREFYESRAPDEWLEALEPFGTDWRKPFLETAPALIAIFHKNRVTVADGRDSKSYYSKESTGIATGFLIAALHEAGLATLTHTPSPMGFLNGALGRPASEKPFVLLVVGYPAENCEVPELEKAALDARSSRH
ncbi:MAG: nitroreductase family protein [Verrucomicrobiales bacterium]|nr:nitroreductase family protein [Verrucomicrobiales bacterium]